MNKRGISPFIATVLLIGIVIITGVFLLAFYSSFSSNQTDEIEDQTYITRLCVEKTDLNLGKSCRVSYLTSTIRLDVENEGAYPISSVNFTFYFGTDVVGTYVLTDSISEYGHIVTEDITDLQSVPEKIGHTKYLVVNGETVMCDPAFIGLEITQLC